ncbi:MAG TPA: hypothetical protein VF699_14385, partial [Caulobacteraceae bacterium]
GPPARAWPAPGRFPLPTCPPLLEAIPDGIQACRCAPNGIGQGAVLGTGPYYYCITHFIFPTCRR